MIVEIDTTVLSIGDGTISNTATAYINDPQHTHGTSSTPTPSTWGALRVVKHVTGDSTKTLAGAVFDVYAVDPSTAGATAVVTGATTGANGSVQVAGLRTGDYWLVETTAPTGYQKLAQPVRSPWPSDRPRRRTSPTSRTRPSRRSPSRSRWIDGRGVYRGRRRTGGARPRCRAGAPGASPGLSGPRMKTGRVSDAGRRPGPSSVPSRTARTLRTRARRARHDLLLATAALIGVAVMMYPPTASWFDLIRTNTVVEGYAQVVDAADRQVVDQSLSAAREYNLREATGLLIDPFGDDAGKRASTPPPRATSRSSPSTRTA